MTYKDPLPVSDLVEALRECAEMVREGKCEMLSEFWHDEAAKLTADACTEAADRLTALEAEVRRCHARLEIDHHFILDGEDAEKLVRVEIPYEDRDWQVDGIEARDATIKELERQIEAARRVREGGKV